MASSAWLTRSRALAAVFLLDGLLALGFGLASLATPRGTFGTIIDLGSASDQSVIFAALASLSGFYVLIGLFSILVAFLPTPYQGRFVSPMIVSHVWAGVKGFDEIGRDWLVGNPWPDIIIHSAFVCAYALLTAAGFLQLLHRASWR
jgi:hypothetical protein